MRYNDKLNRLCRQTIYQNQLMEDMGICGSCQIPDGMYYNREHDFIYTVEVEGFDVVVSASNNKMIGSMFGDYEFIMGFHYMKGYFYPLSSEFIGDL